MSVLGHGGLEAPLDLDARFRMAAARTPEGLETLVRALTDAGLPESRPRLFFRKQAANCAALRTP